MILGIIGIGVLFTLFLSGGIAELYHFFRWCGPISTFFMAIAVPTYIWGVKEVLTNFAENLSLHTQFDFSALLSLPLLIGFACLILSAIASTIHPKIQRIKDGTPGSVKKDSQKNGWTFYIIDTRTDKTFNILAHGETKDQARESALKMILPYEKILDETDKRKMRDEPF